MKEQIKNYETPEVELVEVYVEKGFQTTDTGEGGGEYNPGNDEGI